MKCEHMHKDDPENVACEDCYTTPNYPKSITAKKTGTSKSNHSPLENSNFQKGKNSPVNLQPEGTQNLPMSCLEFEDDNTPDVEEPVQKGCGKEWKNKPGWGKGKLTFICQKGDLCPECKAEKNHSPPAQATGSALKREGTSKSKLRYKTYTDPKCEEKGT